MSDPICFDENDLPFSEIYGDHYYSRNDGRAECAHVFLAGNGLPTRWGEVDHFTIGELGFGTGLNFLETWATWQRTRKPNQQLRFISVEAHPIDAETAKRALSPWPELHELGNKVLCKWDDIFSETQMDEQTTLHVFLGKADKMLPSYPKVNAWFLDGFAPSKNSEMWSEELMRLVAERTVNGGTCASYTAAGWVRRNLEAAGFAMEKRAGFGTKRDMIAGVKL